MAWWFESWDGPLRVAAVGTFAYLALLCVLRVSGKRTLGKFNAFDFVVTVALGSTLSTVLVDRSVPLAEGVTALALLVALQFAVAWLSVRSDAGHRAMTRRGPPRRALQRPSTSSSGGSRETSKFADATGIPAASSAPSTSRVIASFTSRTPWSRQTNRTLISSQSSVIRQ
jgi:hypothetical protein